MYYAISAGIVLFIGLVIWKFFNQYLKFFIIAVILAIPIVYMFMPSAEVKDPDMGKLAYGEKSKSFLGKILFKDKNSGEYVVEFNGQKKRYPTGNVIVSEGLLKKDPTPATSESPSPSTTTK